MNTKANEPKGELYYGRKNHSGPHRRNRQRHIFPEGLLRAEVNPYAIGADGYETVIIRDIESAAEQKGCRIVIIDNLTYLCNSSDKGVDAGLFMMKRKPPVSHVIES